MKTYVNKTRLMKRLVLSVDKKTGETETKFLGKGQAVSTSQDVVFAEEGIKVREAAKRTAKKAEEKNSTEDKE